MSFKAELILLVAGLVVWFAVNLITAARGPTIWHDEVMFSDAAVHWVSGRGFTSTAWPAPPDSPAALNGPLYTALLAGWLTLFGIGPVAVRSFSFVLAGMAAVWLWWLSRRWGVVRIPWLRLAGVTAFLCSVAVSYAYRSGRYDMLGVLLVLALATVAKASFPTKHTNGHEPGQEENH